MTYQRYTEFSSLKLKRCHNVNFAVTDITEDCHNDNRQCHQWRCHQWLVGICSGINSAFILFTVCGQTSWLFEFANLIVHVDFIVNRYFDVYISGYAVEMEILEHQLYPRNS